MQVPAVQVTDNGGEITVSRPDKRLWPSERRSQIGVRATFAVLTVATGTFSGWYVWRAFTDRADNLAVAVLLALFTILFAGVALSYDESEPRSITLSSSAADHFRTALRRSAFSTGSTRLENEQAREVWELAVRLSPPEAG